MFNPIYNRDGSLSYFRVLCLMTAVSCFICGCVMEGKKNSSQDSSKVTAESTQVLQQERKAQTRTQDPSEKFARVRQLAFVELLEDGEYLQTCGVLNKGYDECRIKISDELAEYYKVNLDTSNEGFLLKFEANDSNQDSCRLLEADSNGQYYGYDASSSLSDECSAIKNFPRGEFYVMRDTDNKSETVAPSGFTPINSNN